MSGSRCPSTRLGGLHVRLRVYRQWVVLPHLLAVLAALKRLEPRKQTEDGVEKSRSELRWILRGMIMRMANLVLSNHLHPASAKTSTEPMRQHLSEPRQHPVSMRRTAASRSQRMRTTTTLSGLPHHWKCSALPVTAAQSVSTLWKMTTMSVVLPAVTHSTEHASTHGSPAAAPAVHCAKPITTYPSLDQKAKNRMHLDVATVAREATRPKRHNQLGWAPAAFHSVHASSAPEVFSSVLPHPKTPHNSHTTTPHHTAPSADGVSKMPVLPHNQLPKPPSRATAAGEAGSTCHHSADERNPLRALTAFQKSLARLPVIWKLGVHSDEEPSLLSFCRYI